MNNFFQSIDGIINDVELQINIKKKGDKLTVMIFPKNELKDKASGNLKPLVLTGTALELDAEFIEAISTPIATATGLISNLQEFEDGAAKLAKDNEASKKLAEAKKKESAEKLKKVQELMKDGTKAEEAKDWAKAIKIYTEVRTLVDKKESIDKKLNHCKFYHNQGGGLFGGAEPEVKPEPKVEPKPEPKVETVIQTTPEPKIETQGPIDTPVQPTELAVEKQEPIINPLTRPMNSSAEVTAGIEPNTMFDEAITQATELDSTLEDDTEDDDNSSSEDDDQPSHEDLMGDDADVAATKAEFADLFEM